MSGSYNLVMDQYADFRRTLTLKDKLTNTPWNLVGCVFDCQLRLTKEGDLLYTVSVNMVDAANGKIALYVPRTITSQYASLYPSGGVYDLYMTDTQAFRRRLMEGTWSVTLGVTR